MEIEKNSTGLLGLTAIRQALGLRQTEVAWDCRVSEGHICGLESGRSNGSTAVLRGLCAALDCTADDLLSVPTEQRLREIKAAHLERMALEARADASKPPSEGDNT